MTTPIYQVDAFTSQPFKGKPAAICVLESLRLDTWMQSVAMEMNLSKRILTCSWKSKMKLRLPASNQI